MKRWLFVLVIVSFIFVLGFLSATSVGDSIPIQIQTLDDSGNVITGSWTFTINISNSITCDPVLYSNSTYQTTDSRGIVSYSLENVNLSFNEQYWFCYYRDGVLKETIKAARVPYAFVAKNVTASGIIADSGLDFGNFNQTFNGTTLFINSGNNRVGIGTTTPAAPLEIRSNDTTTSLIIRGLSASFQTKYPAIDFYSAYSTGNGFLTGKIYNSFLTGGAFTDVAMRFQVPNSAGTLTDVLTLRNGKVGINNTSPNSTLDLSGNIRAGDNDTTSTKRVIMGNSGIYPGIWFGANTDSISTSNYAFLYDSSLGTILNTPANLKFFFRVANANKMTISSTGNVGINTTAPNSTLDIVGSLKVQNVPGNVALYTSDSTGNVGIGTSNPSGALEINGSDPYIYFNATINNRTVRIRPASGYIDMYNAGLFLNRESTTNVLLAYGSGFGGNVGIGVLTPATRFDVNGSSIFRGDVNITGALYVNGASVSGGSGVPVNTISAFNQASCPAGWILADGTSGTPDLRGIFIRGSGTNSILKYANSSFGFFNATYGTYGNDSFQGHYHSFGVAHTVYGYTVSGGANQWWGAGTTAIDAGFSVTGATNDGTNGVPRKGAETSPAYYATIYCVKTAEDTPVSNTIWGTSGNNIVQNNASQQVSIQNNLNATGNITSSGGRVYDKTGYAGIPGEIKMYGGSTTPTGWLMANGTNYSRTTYADLYNAIGITYGNNSVNDFKVPDLRGIFPRGAGTNGVLSMANGAAFTGTLGTYQNDSFQGHWHRVLHPSAGTGGVRIASVEASAVVDTFMDTSTKAATIETDGTNGAPRTGAETSPASVGVNFIIKY